MTAVWLLLLLLLSSQSVDGFPYPPEKVSPPPQTEEPCKESDADSKLDTVLKLLEEQKKTIDRCINASDSKLEELVKEVEEQQKTIDQQKETIDRLSKATLRDIVFIT